MLEAMLAIAVYGPYLFSDQQVRIYDLFKEVRASIFS